MINYSEVEVTEVFGPGGTVLISDIECTGKETSLTLCQTAEMGMQSCEVEDGASAGLICNRTFSEFSLSLASALQVCTTYKIFCARYPWKVHRSKRNSTQTSVYPQHK